MYLYMKYICNLNQLKSLGLQHNIRCFSVSKIRSLNMVWWVPEVYICKMVVVCYRVLHGLAVTGGSGWNHCVCVWNCLYGQQCTSVSKPGSNTNDSSFFTEPVDFRKLFWNCIKFVTSVKNLISIPFIHLDSYI